MLEVRSLVVRRHGRALLHGVDVHVATGELLAVVGPNGAGKSTLLRAVSGEWPSEGQISIDGRPLPAWRRADLARAMALLPQHATLGFDFTVEEVVTMGRMPHRRCTRAENAHAVDAVLERLCLDRLRGRSYLSLSGGERQRVQFARTLAQLVPPGVARNRLLVLDEPTAALDLAQQKVLLDTARGLCQEGIAVLAVLHELNLAARYADRVVVLREGRVEGDGGPCDMFTRERLAQAYDCDLEVDRAAMDGRPFVLVRPQAHG